VILKSKKINVVCLGGGSGLSHFVKGIKDLDYIDLTCIVSVADNGGSSGVLKEELNIPALGDIRNVLVALADTPEQLSSLLDYRFDKGFLKDHSLGNIVIAGALQSSHLNLVDTMHQLSDIFKVNGKIIPITNDVVDIKATYFDNSEIIGEKMIGQSNKRIKKIAYLNETKAACEAIEALKEADVIIYSIGSLYTSLLPNLIIPEIKAIIKESKALKIFFANLMSQPGETDNYPLSMYIKAINAHLGFNGIDYVIANNKELSSKIISKYALKKAYPVRLDTARITQDIEVFLYDIAIVKNGKVIHDPMKINKFFNEEIKCLFLEK
jgi:uncharacterized cofD-like protein